MITTAGHSVLSLVRSESAHESRSAKSGNSGYSPPGSSGGAGTRDPRGAGDGELSKQTRGLRDTPTLLF
jgi:hypothetical protein